MRKLRWARQGMGKSGGVRTIYYWAKARDQVYMLTMYRKNEKATISLLRVAEKAPGAILKSLPRGNAQKQHSHKPHKKYCPSK